MPTFAYSRLAHWHAKVAILLRGAL